MPGRKNRRPISYFGLCSRKLSEFNFEFLRQDFRPDEVASRFTSIHYRSENKSAWQWQRSCYLLLHIPPEPSGEGREAAGEILRLLLFMALKTNVYIDAFNLYYGCLRKTPYRWLDLGAFCSRMLTNNQINRIRYFTALVTPRAGNLLNNETSGKFIFALFGPFQI